eukprot:jgi/Chrzof1/4835/Cz15g01010.t1_PSAO[v5.2]
MALALRTSGLSGLQTGRKTAARPVSRRTAVTVRAAGQPYQPYLRRDPLVPLAGFLGWTIPSNIPVSAFGGKSLFGLFTASIGQELSHFPVGPALTDDFWLYLIVYHAGLFACIFFGQIGLQARKQGYFETSKQ